MKLEELLNELLDLLDQNIYIKKMEAIKNNIDDKTLELLYDYQTFKTIDKKKKLYESEKYQEYLLCEREINYLIMAINQKFHKGRFSCESNKW